MKRKAFTLLQAVLLLLLLGIIAAVLFPIFAGSREPVHGGSSCQSNLKQIGLGFTQYKQDYNEKYPILTTEQGWFGALQPYLKSTHIFVCPQEESRGAENLTDYWFNRRFEGVGEEKVAEVSTTFMAGDGEPSDDPNFSIQLLPPLWKTRENSPIRRHLDGANYLYADGHVKWLKPAAVEARQFLVKP